MSILKVTGVPLAGQGGRTAGTSVPSDQVARPKPMIAGVQSSVSTMRPRAGALRSRSNLEELSRCDAANTNSELSSSARADHVSGQISATSAFGSRARNPPVRRHRMSERYIRLLGHCHRRQPWLRAVLSSTASGSKARSMETSRWSRSARCSGVAATSRPKCR